MGDNIEQLRNYQAEIFGIVKKQNSILFLPTGSGKTCIAIWFMKFLSKDLKKPVSEGGKQTIFLVNTTELAYQQSEYVKNVGNFNVRVVCAKEGVDYWQAEQWSALNEFEVLVMTCQCYLNALTHGYMTLENANLLIFDECHHAVRAHPMREIMMKFDLIADQKTCPRVLGLSATILNSNVKGSDLLIQMVELERTFRAKIVTSTFKVDIKKYATKPEEVIKDCVKYQLPSSLRERIKIIIENTVKLIQSFKLKEDDLTEYAVSQTPAVGDILLNAPGMNRSKLLTNALKDVNVHCELFGIYVGYVCCNLYIIQMYRFLFSIEKSSYVDLVLYVINVAQTIRKILHDEIQIVGNVTSLISLIRTSTEKLNLLLNILRTVKSSDKCLIFVERKMTAKALFVIVKLLSTIDQQSSHIKCDFLIGTDCNPLRNTRELIFEKMVKEKVLENFRLSELNVLIATNVVEEGIDIQNCNFVIMFDEIKTYRSYVQSKGRARMTDSRYIVLNDIEHTKFSQRLMNFRSTEKLLEKFVVDREIIWDDDDADSGESTAFYLTPKNASIKEENCVPLIYRYCCSLPRDLFTQLIPFWWLSEHGDNKICKLQLPVNSAIRDVIVGPARSNAKSAKQAVAFQAVKQLHELGALNDHLLPMNISTDLEDIGEWIPNWEKSPDDESSVAQKMFVTEMKVPRFLHDCRPEVDKHCYLHVIDLTAAYERPEIHRQKFCDILMRLPFHYGILTRRQLPEVCRFPVFSDLGQVRVRIRVNFAAIKLDQRKLDAVKNFHKFLFLNVLRRVKKCCTFDTDKTASNSYFVVPLTEDKDGRISMSWKVMNLKIDTQISHPSDLERKTEEYSEDRFFGKVVTPWYKKNDGTPHPFYIVTNWNTGIHLQSTMPENDKTYAEYYFEKYALRAFYPAQPMMEVRVITNFLESTKPRPVSSSAKQKKRKKKDVQTYLPPEFVSLMPMPAVFWYKAILLPSILHRFYDFLLAEDLRQTIVVEAGVGNLNLEIDEKTENHYFVSPVVEPIPSQTFLKERKLRLKERRSSKKAEKVYDLPKDIYREENVTINDVKKFVNYVDQPLYGSHQVREVLSNNNLNASENNNEGVKLHIIRFTDAPILGTLLDRVDSAGPTQYDILQALTLLKARDLINLERLETIGDSLLKYLVSLAILVREDRMNEGHLTKLKCHIISNKYLFWCAKKHSIPSYIRALPFSVDGSWIAPSFSVPHRLRDLISSLPKCSALLKINIPNHEQFSGKISPETVDSIKEELIEFFENVEEIKNGDEITALFYMGKQELAPKSISDVLEALIGVYLESCGIKGAFDVMKFFGILTKEDYSKLMSSRETTITPPEFVEQITSSIPDYDKVEQLLHYKFHDKSLLLQAFTHPSCVAHSLTDCYQKLEFIGDAVLDFLITSYIYEYCGELPPGKITDLRSSLVNNNTFGALAVRLRLQKYLLAHSKPLDDAIASFVSYQKIKNFEIHGNELMILLNEGDTNIAEEVDIPKALGDVFESLAGAIFLDSNYDLNLVWKIYYNFMAEEIKKFCAQIPLNPIRALYEQNLKIKFVSNEEKKTSVQSDVDSSKIVVLLYVYGKDGSEQCFRGRGSNSLAAKRAAAKLALKHLGYTDFVI